MAALGRREMTRRKRLGGASDEVNLAAPTANLVVSPATIEPVATLDVQPSPVGRPIMREDFITKTGILFRLPFN